MSGIVGSGAFSKQSYVKLTAEGPDAGKLRWCGPECLPIFVPLSCFWIMVCMLTIAGLK